MRKIYLILIMAAGVASLHAQSWQNVGMPGFTAGDAQAESIAFHPVSNEPYVAYRDVANGDKASVMRYDGSNWVQVGNAGFSLGAAWDLSFGFDPVSNEPYLAFRDNAVSFGAVALMRFDGSNWDTVGTYGFSTGQVNHTSLAFHPTSNEPYVAYGDMSITGVTVMLLDGSNWDTVGTSGFTPAEGEYINLAFNSTTNEPYVAYSDWGNGNAASAMRFDGSNWVTVGAVGFSAAAVWDLSLAMHPVTNEPYVAYRDVANGDKTTVMRYDGGNWVDVGTAGFSGGYSFSHSLAFHPTTNEPYVCYGDDSNGNESATVMRYDGSNWVAVGTTEFTPNFSGNYDMAIHPVSGEPYVAFRDNSQNKKATVMSFDSTIGVVETIATADIGVYPNPTAGITQIQTTGQIVGVRLYNALGQAIDQEPTNVIDLSSMPEGVYLVQVTTTSGTTTQRIVKQ